MIRSPNLTVTRKRGSEGPRHDPYHYEEYCIERKRANGSVDKLTVHLGLAVWAVRNKKKISLYVSGDEDGNEEHKAQLLVKKVTGYTLRQLRRFEEQYWRRNQELAKLIEMARNGECAAGWDPNP